MIFFISDLHLDSKKNGVCRDEEVVRTLMQVHFEMSQTPGKHTLIFCGDLCDPDTPRCLHSVATAIDFAEMIHALGHEQYWLVGNHDVIEDGRGVNTLSPLKSAGFQVIASPQALTTHDGVRIGFLPYVPRSDNYSPEAVVSMLGACDLWVGHLNAEGISVGSETHAMPRGRDVFWPFDMIAAIYGKDTLLVGGHYHEAQTYIHRSGVALHVVGSPARFTHGEETNVPSFSIYDKDRFGAKTRIQRIPFKKPARMITIDSPDWEGDVDAGDFVRIVQSETFETAQVAGLEQQLRALGAHTTTSAIAGVAKAPAMEKEENASDPESVALQLAKEWPAADEHFRAALQGLTKQVLEETR